MPVGFRGVVLSAPGVASYIDDSQASSGVSATPNSVVVVGLAERGQPNTALAFTSAAAATAVYGTGGLDRPLVDGINRALAAGAGTVYGVRVGRSKAFTASLLNSTTEVIKATTTEYGKFCKAWSLTVSGSTNTITVNGASVGKKATLILHDGRSYTADNIARQSINILSASLSVTGRVDVSAAGITLTTTGGNGVTYNFSDYPRLNAMVAAINAAGAFKASVVTGADENALTSALDAVSGVSGNVPVYTGTPFVLTSNIAAMNDALNGTILGPFLTGSFVSNSGGAVSNGVYSFNYFTSTGSTFSGYIAGTTLTVVSSTASFSGYISGVNGIGAGTQLTVTSVASGSIIATQALTGTGVTSGTAIVTPVTGSGLTVYATAPSGIITAAAIASAGSGYSVAGVNSGTLYFTAGSTANSTTQAVLSVGLTGGAPTGAVSVSSGGTGYTAGTGSGLLGTITHTGGVLSAFSITTAGSAYLGGGSGILIFSVGGTNTSPAFFSCSVTSGVPATGVATLITGGVGYTATTGTTGVATTPAITGVIATAQAGGTGTGGTGTYTVSISQQVASSGSPASITAAASPTGTIVLSQTISGANVSVGTTITALGTGSGGTGTYTVSASQNVGSSGSPIAITGSVVTGSVSDFDPDAVSSDWTNAFVAAQSVPAYFVVPMTSSAAYHAAALSHAQAMSLPSGKSERIAVCGGASAETYLDAKVRAAALNDKRAVLVWPGIVDYDSNGLLSTLPPYYLASQIAGTLAAADDPAMPLTNKTIRLYGLETTSSPAAIDDLVNNGVFTVKNDIGRGFVVVQSLTTWTGDGKTARREISTVRAADETMKLVRNAVSPFVGSKSSQQLVDTITTVTIGMLNIAAARGLIISDPNNPLQYPAYKNVSVRVFGDAYYIDFNISPAKPANYILITAYVS
jgi:hypothetical protein